LTIVNLGMPLVQGITGNYDTASPRISFAVPIVDADAMPLQFLRRKQKEGTPHA
jgi:hypothetical protein